MLRIKIGYRSCLLFIVVALQEKSWYRDPSIGTLFKGASLNGGVGSLDKEPSLSKYASRSSSDILSELLHAGERGKCIMITKGIDKLVNKVINKKKLSFEYLLGQKVRYEGRTIRYIPSCSRSVSSRPIE